MDDLKKENERLMQYSMDLEREVGVLKRRINQMVKVDDDMFKKEMEEMEDLRKEVDKWRFRFDQLMTMVGTLSSSFQLIEKEWSE